METLFARISKLEESCGVYMQKIVDLEKDKGNDEFKSGNYKKAIKHYTEAIAADNSGNVSLYTNRALAYQKLGELNEALADAKAAISFDHTAEEPPFPPCLRPPTTFPSANGSGCFKSLLMML